MSVPHQSRIFDLLKVQCRIFSQTFNPQRLRTGNRVLRQRLRGPSVAAYYPRRVATIKDLQKLYKGFDEEMETWDDDEEDRLEHLLLAKQRGKGAPKKKRTAEESKKMKGKKRPAVAPAAPKELKF
ncbi:MAG: mitochondral 37S ribosomal protein S27 [Alectoria sarmentosa]|nr:MAG: mitochondral 37S ribosomal protein S27 [Alectoria sarmentosa]CAD6585205.1 MAG: mitochondral 37S ribosomal protein S27 [Alectoria sarmentosa]